MMVAREIARRRTASETRIARTAYTTVRGRVVAVLRQLAEEHGERFPTVGSVPPRRRFSQEAHLCAPLNTGLFCCQNRYSA